MKGKIRWFGLGLFVAFLFATNPSREEFEAYVQHRVEEKLGEDDEGGHLGRIMTDLGSQVVGSLAARISERSTFGLFSLYTVDVGADGNPDEDWRFLGVGGSFVEISSPDMD